MAAQQGIRLASSRGTTLRNIIRLIPAVVIIAATLNTVSCNGNHTLFPQVHGGGGGSGSKTPTATATAGTGALAFVTNFNDGKVSSFTRNTSTGALTLTKPQVTAGKKHGPRGVIASPNGNFLYVANISDEKIYEFSVNQTTGALTPLPTPSVSNGNATQPDELAINAAGTLLWVTGMAGTVTAYTINSSTGQLTRKSSIGGFNTPFGIAVHPTLAVIYVSDTTTGLIQPMSYNTSTGALAKNFTATHSADVNANTPAAIAIDAGGADLFIADQKLGEVSTFAINSNGSLTQGPTFANTSTGAVPVGVGIAVNTSIEYLITANQGGGSVSSFIVNGGTNVISPPVVAAPYNGPTGLVVDPQNAFAYAADKNDGTVSQSTIKGTCVTNICVGPTVPTESPANPSSGPFGITLAP
jgi:6-phosphogluconolactonase (cycloisomerase 2 family)